MAMPVICLVILLRQTRQQPDSVPPSANASDMSPIGSLCVGYLTLLCQCTEIQ